MAADMIAEGGAFVGSFVGGIFAQVDDAVHLVSGDVGGR